MQNEALVPVYGRVNGKNGLQVAQARVDAPDAATASAHRWYLGGRKRAFVVARLDGRTVLLHRLLVGELASGDAEVHHRNGDHLDCRRTNLVVVHKDCIQ